MWFGNPNFWYSITWIWRDKKQLSTFNLTTKNEWNKNKELKKSFSTIPFEMKDESWKCFESKNQFCDNFDWDDWLQEAFFPWDRFCKS